MHNPLHCWENYVVFTFYFYNYWPFFTVTVLYELCQRFKSTWSEGGLYKGGMGCCIGTKIGPARLSIIEMDLVCCLTRKQLGNSEKFISQSSVPE